MVAAAPTQKASDAWAWLAAGTQSSVGGPPCPRRGLGGHLAQTDTATATEEALDVGQAGTQDPLQHCLYLDACLLQQQKTKKL